MAENATEDDLIRAVREGRLQAYEALIHRHTARLKAFVSLRLPVPHLVEEISHEAFVFAYRHLDDFEIGTDFGKWLRAIAFNLVRKEVLRYSRAEKNQEKYLEHCMVERSASVKAAGRPDSPVVVFLEECVKQLPDSQRELISDRYRRAHSTREMAARTGRSEAWVRTTLYRLRAALRICVEGKLSAEERARATS